MHKTAKADNCCKLKFMCACESKDFYQQAKETHIHTQNTKKRGNLKSTNNKTFINKILKNNNQHGCPT